MPGFDKTEVAAMASIFGSVFLLFVVLLVRYLCRVRAFEAAAGAANNNAESKAEVNKGQRSKPPPVDDGEEYDEPVEQFHEIARAQSKRSLRRAKEGGVDYRRSIKGKKKLGASSTLAAVDEEYEVTSRALGTMGLHGLGDRSSFRSPDTISLDSMLLASPGARGGETDVAGADLALINNGPAGEEPLEIDAGLSSPNSNPLFRVQADTPTWYAGAAPRAECEAAVLKAKHGAFLVRDSVARSKFVLCINDHGAVRNFQIKVEDLYRGGYSFAGGTYQSMEDIIDLLYTTPLQSKHGGLLTIADPAPFNEDAEYGDGALMEC